MSDLISRQAAIDALHAHLMYRMGTESNKKRLDEWINSLPSAQPEQRWIPCSKGLPKDFTWFYATVRSLVDDRKNWVIEGCYNRLFKWGKIPMIDSGDAEVIAWMPKVFPEPFKEKS